jgi:hypothetical protein
MIALIVTAAGLGAGCKSSDGPDMQMAADQSRSMNSGTNSEPARARMLVKTSMTGAMATKVRRDPHALVSYPEGAAPAERTMSIDPVTGEPYRLYFYYPKCEVYLDVRRSVYFWQDGSAWRNGPQLPAMIASAMTWSDVERIGLSTDSPFLLHDMVKSKYPSLTTLRRTSRAIRRSSSSGGVVSVPADH